MKKNSFWHMVWVLRNRIILAVFCCLSLAFLLIYTRKDIKNTDATGKNIICFGDSLTFGYGVKPGEDYPSYLKKMINKPVVNMGIDADTSMEALKRLDSDVLSREPYIVIIEFGGNDFLRKIPMESTIKNIGEMVDRIQAKGAMAAIADISAGMFLMEYRAALSSLSREKKVIFIPQLLGGIITNPSMKSDFLHPNALGYKMIAQRIYAAIRPYLERKLN